MADATAQAAAKKKALAKKLRLINNVNSTKYFAAGMAALVTLFIVFHWTRYFYKKIESRKVVNNKLLKVPLAITRVSRSLLLRKVPIFTSLGHALLFMGYIGTCLAVAFTNIDWSTLIGFSKRLGWVTIANVAFITFLSLKNTPLAFLTAYSYERLNVLHRTAGYVTVICAVMHGVVYIQAWHQSNNLHELKETEIVVGIVAGCAMLIIAATSILIRKVRYEAWYLIHITMYTLIIITVGMHRPELATRSLIIVIFSGALWFSDRFIRFAKISLFSFGNTATIIPLPHGGTRITLRKSPSRAKPGTHCFLWIPKIRAAETHPFTVASLQNDSLSFVIAAYDGFTRDLHNYAINNPGAQLKASIDGPYGTVPDFTTYDKLVLIAGGSGGSFTFGVASDTIRKSLKNGKTFIEFVWVVREQDCISWFSGELQELISSHMVNLHIHSTQNTSPVQHSPQQSSSGSVDEKEDQISLNNVSSTGPISATDIEKHAQGLAISTPQSVTVHAGRPDVARLLSEIVQNSEAHDRVAVAACGPDSLMAVVRKTVARNITVGGPSVELHCEQFGW
ncbi:ferric reductase like transmembrane component [Phlyctema vagabunda]|uniref:ferric-chelate reductase (NADPH) n=1 Tax=Phlyctema vagabunda TaxID=108571 RepID=A0ABR4P1N1_9HELO